jgi:hypothetical protein
VFAVFAPSLPAFLTDHEEHADTALTAARRRSRAWILCGEDALRIAAAAPVSRPPSTRLGKNGGTQSKCVENTTDGGSSVAISLTDRR